MKIAGSYASLIRGVSQQAPEVRVSGQHTEQVNMLSDPVAGLTRRRGTILQSASYQGISADAASYLASGTRFTKVPYITGGKEYAFLLLNADQADGTTAGMNPVLCYCVTDKTWLPVSWATAGQGTIAKQRGFRAACAVGQYLLFALEDTPCSIATSTQWNQAGYKKAVVWVRGGVYNRIYSIRTNGGEYWYQTPDSSAAGSAMAIQPSQIAYNLSTKLTAAGFTGVQYVGAYVCFDLPAGADVSVNDGGDGSLMRSAGLVVSGLDDLPKFSVHGQIVKVQPAADSWFYMQAVGKADNGGSLQEVIWRECAGSKVTRVDNLGLARVYDGTVYIGLTSATNVNGLSHMPGAAGTPPQFVPAIAGDTDLNLPHRWMTNQIQFLSMFQDRLLVGSGAALSVSGAGDYLNFFRSTMTTVQADDGFEVVAQGGEDDVLRHAVTYNRNLVIFGDKRQYLIPGTTPFSPTSPNMSIMTVYANSAECRPVAAGGQIYYANNREGAVSVHQIQPGAYVDSAESFPASAQIGNYIPAPAAEIDAITGAPSLLMLRSRASPRSLYVFSYVDLPDGRKQDAWYRLDFDVKCGTLLGVYPTPGGVLLFWSRQAADGGLWLAADLLPLSTADNDKPYLDSMRPRSTVGTQGLTAGTAGWHVAFDDSTDRFLIGGDLDDAQMMAELDAYPEASSLWAGLPMDSYVIPTNPLARDSSGQPLLSGRTVITRLSVNTRASSGMGWELTAGGMTKPYEVSGRVLGDLLNYIGRVPVTSTIVSVPVGREARQYSLKLKARRWFPLNLIGIEWTGQSFNRTPRASSGG